MINKLFTTFLQLTKYPRIVLDLFISFFFINNDYSLLEKYFNKKLLIVGNGPSLNKTPLDKINMISVGMNKINLIFNKTKWRPDIIVATNGLVIKQNKFFFNSTDIILILPIKAFYLGIKRRKNIIFINISTNKTFQNNIKQPFGYGSTVTYIAFQLAAYLRARSINIVGVDHSFDFSGNPHEIKKLNQDDNNHFDPNYFKGMNWGLPDLVGSEYAYKKAKYYFDSNNIKVFDYTIGGKLDIFKKGDIRKILKQ